MPTRETLGALGVRIANAQNMQLDESARRLELLEARSLLEAEFSHDETRRLLYNELRATRFSPDGSYCYRYIRAVYGDFFIYERCDDDGVDRLYRCDYSIDDQAAVTMGAPVEVREETQYVPVAVDVTESGNRPIREQTISLREASTVIGKDGRSLVKIIAPGKGSSGLYPRDVLERDVPIVFPKGTQMFSNHASAAEEANRQEGEIERLVGQFLEDPIYLEESAAPEGEGSYVWVEFFDDWKPTIQAKGHAVGVSINGEGLFKVNEAGEIEITQLTAGQSVDVVTRAGAGGKIVSLRESAKQLQEGGRQAPSVPTIQSNTKEDRNEMTEEEKQKMAALEAENAKLKVVQAAREAAAKAIESLNLPTGARARIVEAQAQKPVLTESGALDVEKFGAQVKEAATDEIRYATENYGWGGGEVEGVGETETTKTRESAKPVITEVAGIRSSLGLG